MARSYTPYHPALLTDLYHPDSAYVAWRAGRHPATTFDLYARRAPFGGTYLLVAGLEMALESVDTSTTDLLDISPALVIPYVIPRLAAPLPLRFIGSGLIQTSQQIQRILRAGAAGVAVTRKELWREQLVGVGG